MPVGIMYNLETEEKRKRRAITCPSHNPIIVSMNQPTPEKNKMKPAIRKTTVYSSWLPLPALGVFLGRRSGDTRVSK
jgi:hypothetical protein